MNTETPAVTPAVLIADQLRNADAVLQHAESVVNQAAEKHPLRYGGLVAGLAITRAELKFAAKRWRSGSPV